MNQKLKLSPKCFSLFEFHAHIILEIFGTALAVTVFNRETFQNTFHSDLNKIFFNVIKDMEKYFYLNFFLNSVKDMEKYFFKIFLHKVSYPTQNLMLILKNITFMTIGEHTKRKRTF